jgi:hypothetical protein
MTITVSEGLGLLKTLKERHKELTGMRDENSNKERRFYGAAADKMTERLPVYNVKLLDKSVNRLAMEIRRLDAAVKKHNALAVLEGYDWNDEILGVIELADEEKTA